MRRLASFCVALAALLSAAGNAHAWELDRTLTRHDPGALPAIAIIIDDIGHAASAGRRAIALPGPVAMSVLPHTPHGRSLAVEAHARGKEVMLHLPLQAESSNQYLGPGAILLDTTREEFAEVMLRNLAAVPHASGVNNHMGSLLTRHPGHMAWLMEEIKRHDGLFFVDSRTTRHSVALALAEESGVPAARRDVFLDNDPDPVRVAAQFDRLTRLALRDGAAIGIGHPHPSTMSLLEDMLPRIQRSGVRLVRVRDLIDLRLHRP